MQLHYGSGSRRERKGNEDWQPPTMAFREHDDAAPSPRVGSCDFGLSEETGRIVLTTLRQGCRALPVSPQDRDDLVQDVVLWIARHRIASRPITKGWLWSTLSRFAWTAHHAPRWQTALDELPEGREPTRAPRRPSASLEELTRSLGEKERRVVELLLEGHTWESALRQLGICHGSGSRWRSRIRRLVACALGREPKD